MFVAFSCCFSVVCLILMCLVSKRNCFSNEYVISTTQKVVYDYGNVTSKLVIFDTGKQEGHFQCGGAENGIFEFDEGNLHFMNESTDKTIWPFSTEGNTINPPLTKMQGDVVVDKNGNKFEPYPQVKDIFHQVKQHGHKVGIISQNPDCDTIYKLISFFDFGKYVDYKACFVGPKKDLVRKLQQVSNYSVDDILYLDDEHDDIPSVMELDVTALMSTEEGGVTWDDVKAGLAVFTMVGPWSLPSTPKH